MTKSALPSHLLEANESLVEDGVYRCKFENKYKKNDDDTNSNNIHVRRIHQTVQLSLNVITLITGGIAQHIIFQYTKRYVVASEFTSCKNIRDGSL